MESGRTNRQLDELATLLRDGLGPASTVVPGRDRQLAVELLGPDEQMRAVAVGRLKGRALLTGQIFLATDTRLIVSEAHRWKSSWHRSLEWAQIRAVELAGSHLLIHLGDERLEIRSLRPLIAAGQFEELHRGAGTPATNRWPGHDVAAVLAERMPRFPGWMNDLAVHRLLQELQPGETVLGAMRFGVMRSGVVVLTDRRIGRLPDAVAEPSVWFDRDQVSTVSLDDDAGLLIRTKTGDIEWAGLAPADELPGLIGPLLADNRRRDRARRVIVDAAPTPALSGLPAGVRRSEVDGVPVFWVDRPPSPRLSAQLFFGVGQADEPFLDGQITHLLEHVLMRRFADATYETNASVAVWVTAFDVSSRPATVSRHLREVCEAISDFTSVGPDPAVVEAERAVLRAEDVHVDGPGLPIMLPAAFWFGRSGVGLVGESTLGMENADAQALTQWCRRWFVRGNAALVLDGPPPEDLRLPLPSWDHPPRIHTSARVLPAPAWTPGPPGFLVSFRVRSTPGAAVLVEALTVRWTRLFRHDKGLVYDIATSVLGLPGDEIMVSIGADTAPEHADRVAALLAADLELLSSNGFCESDVRAAQDRLAELSEDPEWMVGLAADQAVRSVGGHAPGPVVDSGPTERVTLAQVNRAWGSARQTLLVAASGQISDLPLLEADRTPPIIGRTWTRTRRGSFMVDESILVSGPDGVSLRWGPEEGDDWRTVRYAEIVALGIDRLAPRDSVVVLFSRSGTLVGIRARDWRDGRLLIREVLLAVPAYLHTYLPDRMRPYCLDE